MFSKVSGLMAMSCAALLLLVSGCASPTATPAGDGDDRIRVVASFYPLVFLSERIGGDAVSVESLTQPGAEPHDLELSPRQIADIGEAGLVVYEEGFQTAVDEGIATATPANVVNVSQGIELRPAAEEEEGEHAHEHDADHPEGEEGHDHGQFDPHIWLDPQNMETMARTVADGLIKADPDRRQQFEGNLAALTAELKGLDADFSGGLADCRRTEFITSHAAFGYLAERYRLTQIGISGLEPDSEPSPARIAEVQQQAREHGVTTIFYETLVSPDVARSIAGDLGLKTAVLDPVEGLTDASAGTDYVQVMRANLKALQAANGCTG